MHSDLLKILCCPRTGAKLRLEPLDDEDGRVRTGWLVTEDGSHRYIIEEFVPRLAPGSNYAANFGMQWNKFAQTQLDSHSGQPISAERFWAATGWRSEELNGQVVLDVGCGAGRFAEVALEAGARVIALDYSSAVDACFANLRQHAKLDVVQGDIYTLPFVRRSFAFVYSLGVLQHTPDVATAFAALPPMLAPGGRLCVDVYAKSWRTAFHPKSWLRPFTRRMAEETLFARLQSLVPMLLKVSDGFATIPIVGPLLRRLAPVANYSGVYPLSEDQLEEWALLDTFDWLSAAYDKPQTASTLQRWLGASALEMTEVLKAGHLVGRGRSPSRRRR